MEVQKVMTDSLQASNFMDGWQVKLDVADGEDKSTLNIWLMQGDEKQLRYSEDLYKLRSNFMPYCNRVGMTFEQFVDLAVQYAELAIMMHDCDFAVFQREMTEEEKAYIKEYATSHLDICIDSRITDEQKFMCALLACDQRDYGLTSNALAELYSWSRYKARKIAKSVAGKYVATLVDEEAGGYYGKGWIIDSSIRTFYTRYRQQVFDARRKSAQDANDAFWDNL